MPHYLEVAGTVLLLLVNLAMSISVTIHAVLWKRDTRSVIAWVGLAWLAPIFGALAYFLFGVNRIQRKAVRLQTRRGRNWRSARNRLTGQQLDSLASRHPNLLGLAHLGYQITGWGVLPGNHIEPLKDGDELFPAMIDAINSAERSISLQTYIFDHDRAGDLIRDALLAAQQRGVEVRVLIDAVGSHYSHPSMVGQLRNAGIRAAAFLPTLLPRFPAYANLRNHRKILVVDGKIGFTGGTNIREGHWLRLNPRTPVQCLHFRLRGPVVAQLQETFAFDWAFTTGELLAGDSWFRELGFQGNVWARGIPHGPDEDFEKMADTIVGAVAVARKRVRIVTPYFLPNASQIQALNVAALRGVNVQIFLPEVNNIPLVHWASRAQMWQILGKGCNVFYTPPPFDHTKLMIVDDAWSLIGSTNWDPRSLRLNFEFNVECYDDELAEQLNRIVDQKAHHARPVTLEEFNSRSFTIQLRDGMARLFTPYL